MSGPDISESEYLRRIELLALDVVGKAGDEGWLSYRPDPDDATPLQRSINELARTLRHYHFDDDGCLDDRPTLRLAGVLLIKEGQTPDKLGGYTQFCTSLGIDIRPEGWALWHIRDRSGGPLTLITDKISTTEGILLNWSRGRDVHPARPHRAAVVRAVRGWIEPMILSPDELAALDLEARHEGP